MAARALLSRLSLPGPSWAAVVGAGSMGARDLAWQHGCLGDESRHQSSSTAGPHQPEEAAQSSTKSSSSSADDKQVLYKGKWIMPVRLLVRAKVFQLMGGGAIALAVAGLTADDLSGSDMFWLGALASGCMAGSLALWYYGRRYVGELSLLQEGRVARFSTLDFWGNREDNDVLVQHIQPPFKGVRPKEVQRITAQLLFPVNVDSERIKRQFILSVKAGVILQPEALFKLLNGQHVEELSRHRVNAESVVKLEAEAGAAATSSSSSSSSSEVRVAGSTATEPAPAAVASKLQDHR